MTRAAGDYVKAANRYIADVLSGKIPACRYLKLACERQKRDLARVTDPKWPYTFDVKRAEKVCKVAESMPHIKGEWAERRELIALGDWQCFVYTTQFGWVWKTDSKRRRFREGYWKIPRKNSKSTMGAVAGLHMWAFDGESGAEVYSGATTEKQAWEVFGPARLMVTRTPALLEDLHAQRLDEVVRAKSLFIPEDSSKFQPIIGKPGDGASPSCAIVDEFHEHETSHLVDTMKTGMLARKRPLLLMITTAGVNLAGPCYDKELTCIKVLDGTLENEELFVVIYGIDDEDDWADPKVLVKANPNLDVSVDRAALEADQRQAVLNPIDQNRFKTKHLNVWCAAKVAWMPIVAWDANADQGLLFDEFRLDPGWFGLDLASKDDLACFGKLFRRMLDGEAYYWFFGRYYLPEGALQVASPNQAAYRKWSKQLGHDDRPWLTLTDGEEIDFDWIKADLLTDRTKVERVQELVYDPWRATYLAQQAAAEGFTTVEVRQTTERLSLPMKEVLSATKAGRLHHDGNPITRWMISNVTARVDANGNIFPRKEKPHMKIDGAVTLITCMSRAMVAVDDAASMAGWIAANKKVNA